MEILYNDEEYLEYCFNTLFYSFDTSGKIIDISVLEFFAKNRGYGDDFHLCVYDNSYDDVVPRPVGYVAYIRWELEWGSDDIEAVIFFEPHFFYQHLRKECLRTALKYPRMLKPILRCLSKIKRDLKI